MVLVERDTEKEEGRGAARLAMAAKLDLRRPRFLFSSPPAGTGTVAVDTATTAAVPVASPSPLTGTSTSLRGAILLPLGAVDTRRNLNPQSSSSTVSNPPVGPSLRFYTTSSTNTTMVLLVHVLPWQWACLESRAWCQGRAAACYTNEDARQSKSKKENCLVKLCGPSK